MINAPRLLADLTRLLVGATRPLDELLNAYRNGGGVPFHAYGADMREGQADVNRPAVLVGCYPIACGCRG